MYIPRDIEKDIDKWLDEREMIAIIGPRQSGKTTLLNRIGEKMIGMGLYDKEHVVYSTFDDEMERFKFDNNFKDYIEGKIFDSAKYLFLLDEVQYLDNGGERLKVLYDKYHETIKFIITGSSSLDLRNIGGSLVGRLVNFELLPFSFGEFLSAKDKLLHKYYVQNRFDFTDGFDVKTLVHIDELNGLLREYITFGGFPRIVLIKNLEKKELLLRQLVTMYIEKDILKIYGQPFRNDALKLLQYLAFHSAQLINFEDISTHLRMDAKRVNEIINILDNSFIIKLVRPHYKNLVTELRKRPKTFFVDCGIRNVLANDFSFSKEKGFLLENFVFTQLIRYDGTVKYWRTTAKAEVDLIYKGIPVEVKTTPKITRAMQSFISTYSPPYAVVANFNELERKERQEIPIYFIPASLI